MPGSLNGVYEYAKDENGESLSLGLRETVHDRHNSDIAKKLLRSATSIDLYSVPVRVPMIRDLVAMKRHANRPKDRSDIKLLKTFYPGVKV
jgi:predicted nucleotidyltransferase